METASSPPTARGLARLAAALKDRYLGADPRWLGVFRITLGLLLCVEVLRRWYYARDFYTNDGFLPNHYSLFRPMGRNVFSIYHAFSTFEEVSVAFALTLGVFVAFTVGWRTKLSHVLSAVAITSLNARNLFVENGGTVVTSIITVYSLFLPLGARFSVDALRRSWTARRETTVSELCVRAPITGPTERVHSLAVLLLLVQWSAIYFFNTVHKNGVGWRDGSAIHYFLQQDRIVTPLAVWVRGVAPQGLLRAMTWATLVVEGALAVLILSPVGQVWCRRLVLVGVWGLHGTIAALSNLGPFSYVMSLFPLLLLSGRDWALLTRWLGTDRQARVVVVDGASESSLAAGRLLVRLDPFERLRFIDANDPECPAAGRHAARDGVLTVVDPRDGSVHTGRRALSGALGALPFGLALRALLRVPGVIALGRRVWAMALPSLVAPTPPPRSTLPWAREACGLATLAREGAVAVLFVAIVGQITTSNAWVPALLRMNRPEWMIRIVEYPRLLQGWSMFAPEPPFDDGRVVVDGRTIDGRKLDPFTGEAPDLDPHAPTGWGHEQFVCDYHNRIRFPGHADDRRHLQQWLLSRHRFHGRPEDRLVAFDVWWVHDRSPRPGVERGEPLPPEKLLSYGRVDDSGARARLPQSGTPIAPRAPVPLIGP